MKIFQENIIHPDNLLVVKEESFEYNEFPLHTHPEYEIILILESRGQRIVGDTITEYEAIDLCMFGAGLPHTFNTKGQGEHEAVTQIVIQFHEDFLGAGFFDRHPFTQIRDLLQRSSRGLCFTGKTRQTLTEQITSLLSKSSPETVIGTLNILHQLSVSEEFTYLSSPAFTSNEIIDDSSRMNRIYEYIDRNFRKDITLDEVAAVAYLSPSAFCRYFKKYTRKTLSEFLVDYRIGYACRLLQDNDITISQASSEAGFNNVSYFNRKFKAIKGRTPMEYQRHFLVPCPSPQD